ncbi:hypothetical protein GH733_018828 [Mirounga leonina]|nr:hypothetical protein GH733_018828 [Mirounga leonina]
MSKTAQQSSTLAISVTHTEAHASGSQQVPQLVPAGQVGGGGWVGKARKACASKQAKQKEFAHGSQQRRVSQHRERNNMAVKKSQWKTKQKAKDTLQRVIQFKEENERLKAKIKLLAKELSVLKDLFLEHVHYLADNLQPTSTENRTTTSDNTGRRSHPF